MKKSIILSMLFLTIFGKTFSQVEQQILQSQPMQTQSAPQPVYQDQSAVQPIYQSQPAQPMYQNQPQQPVFQNQPVPSQPVFQNQPVTQIQQPIAQTQPVYQPQQPVYQPQQPIFQPQQPVYQPQQPIFLPQPAVQPVFQVQPTYQPQLIIQPQPVFQNQPAYQPQPIVQPQPVFQNQPAYQPQPASHPQQPSQPSKESSEQEIQELKRPSLDNFAVGFHVGQYQRDFAVGIDLTTPYIRKSNIALKVSANLQWYEYIPFGETKVTWAPYFAFHAGVKCHKILIPNTLSTYGEGGGVAFIPNQDLSDKKVNYGGYALLGIEVSTGSSSGIFLEMGGLVSRTKADKLPGMPFYSTGFFASTGFRVYL